MEEGKNRRGDRPVARDEEPGQHGLVGAGLKPARSGGQPVDRQNGRVTDPPLRGNVPPLPRRRSSLRLVDHDYASTGAYFITVCTHDRQKLFGAIVDGVMVVNDCGKIVEEEWIRSGKMRDEIELIEWMVMPDHFHGIVEIVCRGDRLVAQGKEHNYAVCRGDRPVAPTGEKPNGPPPKSIGSLMAGFKSAVTKRINTLRNTPGQPVWHRGFYDHIIRDEASLNEYREYIQTNPVRWEEKNGRQ